MSGIYIPGMEMPETCCDCRFAVDGWCYAAEKQDNKQYLNDTQRTNWCPLVPVPDHGRLIDADKIPFLESENGCIDDYAFRYDINEMTTIIQADGGAE